MAAKAAAFSAMLTVVPFRAVLVLTEPKGLLAVTSENVIGWEFKPYTAYVSVPPVCPPIPTLEYKLLHIGSTWPKPGPPRSRSESQIQTSCGTHTRRFQCRPRNCCPARLRCWYSPRPYHR